MVTERDFELLDDYLANRMDAAERVSFEQKIQSDPDLQNEYNLQQNLVAGLKKARMSELKSMLQNVPVPVPSKGGASIGAKFALGAFTAAVIATGLYLYVTKEEPKPESIQQADTATEEKLIPQDQTAITEQPQKEEPSEPETEQETTHEQKAVDNAKKVTPKQSPAKQPVIDVFDPSKEGEETATSGEESPRTTAVREESKIPAEVVKSKNYSFHYQFKGGKLFLYGPFEDGPYEILEFFKTEQERTVFLYFKDAFYLLEEKDTKIKPLNAITDPALINKLKEYRSK
ncbi:MAG TPA: hypothetical protein VEB86_19440 [Chryseosolibacter sp.]|nr:hypothetical protein [Chryseosolibacter sp.]